MNVAPRSADEQVGHCMGVRVTEAAQDLLHLVRFAVSIGIAEEEQFGSMTDIGAVFVG